MRFFALLLLGTSISVSAFMPAQNLPLRTSSRHTSKCVAGRNFGLKMIDESLIPGIAAGLAGIGISAGFVAFMERAAVKSASKIDEKVFIREIERTMKGPLDLMTKLASKVDGGEAENKFSGSDQSLDALIAAMEEAQGVKKPAAAPEKKAAVVDDDDGW